MNQSRMDGWTIRSVRCEGLKYSYDVVHGVAQCADCKWNTASYKNAQAISKIHARTYEHKVSGGLGIAFEYDGRKVKA